MRIGVVCEGPTDFVAIEAFVGHKMSQRHIAVEFVPLQPAMDNTSPEAGWGNVLLWLHHNPPQSRILKFFGGGLFEGNLGTPPLNGILFHLDTDILGEPSFTKFILDRYGIVVGTPVHPRDRANEITSVLRSAWKDAEMTNADRLRHVPAPAVESTEAWCLAAFSAKTQDFEVLTGQNLIDQFMVALEITEGRPPKPPYAEINKDMKRRKRFCDLHAPSSERVQVGCEQFRAMLDRLIALS